MTATEFLAVIFGSGVVATAVTIGAEWIREERTEKRDLRYLAMRVAVILEKFAIDCSNLVVENEAYDTSDGEAGSFSSKLPDLPPFPTDADWKSVDPVLASRVLSLQNEVYLTQFSVSDVWGVHEPDEIGKIVNGQAGKCGAKAFGLAHALRTAANLPAADLSAPGVATVESRLQKTNAKYLEVAAGKIGGG